MAEEDLDVAVEYAAAAAVVAVDDSILEEDELHYCVASVPWFLPKVGFY